MSDLQKFFEAQEESARWNAERENASARYDLAKIRENCALLMSQHQPIASLGLGRERLRLVFIFLNHGDLKRLYRDFDELRLKEARKG